ncbi:MAG: nicotinamide mononucleotide transporter [Oscillospiraceae bacterium]|nr:nicotinamide mononucleotide transporter [Oscillospiraceae bacterium]
MKIEGHKHNVIKIIAAVTFILIAVFSVIFNVNILNVLPLFISIFIMFLQSRVNRYAFLLGSINSILYAVAYFYMTLYSTALYALLVSFPIQIFTFFNWKKNTQNGRTETKSLSARARIIMFASMALVWLVFFLIFSAFNSTYLIFDNTISVIGIVTSILCAFRFSEYAILQAASTIANLILYGFMVSDDISKIVWLIFSIYSAMCSIIAFININKQSKEKLQ